MFYLRSISGALRCANAPYKLQIKKPGFGSETWFLFPKVKYYLLSENSASITSSPGGLPPPVPPPVPSPVPGSPPPDC